MRDRLPHRQSSDEIFGVFGHVQVWSTLDLFYLAIALLLHGLINIQPFRFKLNHRLFPLYCSAKPLEPREGRLQGRVLQRLAYRRCLG